VNQSPHYPASPTPGGVIERVQPGSLADRAGVRAGARLLAVNGTTLLDVVDYQFEAAEERIEFLLEQDGAQQRIVIDKHPDEDAGLDFEEATFDGTRICVNKCPFCFLKGLPKGLRRTMYIKDDDYRLSFLHGNFVTLTNLSESDWERLEAQRLSPLHVSVHATEPDLRRHLLGNDDIPDILQQLRRLGSIGIRSQTQVVLCPGINDGPHLTRTVEDLASLFPTVQAVSVVPVGASIQYAERMAAVGKDGLGACSPTYARALIAGIRRLQRRFRAELGSTFCYLSDEFYLTAGAGLPSARNYDGFAQYENGVGMTRSLLDDWSRTKRKLARDGEDFSGLRLTLACGTLIAPTLRRLAEDVAACTNLRIAVVPVPNSFFGESIRVSGLLGAGDFIGALRQAPPADVVFLPRSALDYFGKHFLDDGTPGDVERVLGQPIAFATAWSEVIEQLHGWHLGQPAFQTSPGAASNGRFWALPEHDGAQSAADG
jgi:putative radical SAM enzyme (TIGR03279 family)